MTGEASVSTPAADPAALFACPRCDGPLAAASPAAGQAPAAAAGGAPATAAWRCRGCRVDYPVVGGLPCLYADPDAALAEWRMRYAREAQTLALECGRLREALETVRAGGRAPSCAAARLGRLLEGREQSIAQIRTLLGPFAGAGDEPEQASLATLIALRTRLPPAQGVMTYEANVFRDWADWGAEENARSLEAVAPHVPADASRVLVLGSGAGRLSYDIHQQCRPGVTVALDINPLLARVGMLAAGGEQLSLYEFPLAPRRLADVAVSRTLRAPEPARAGLGFVLGDVRRPPFRAASADVVVTPWLVDILDEDFATLAARVNQLLRDGGLWICFGSLSFTGPDPRQRYSLEETCELICAAGFDAPRVEEHALPYLQSPASRHGRVEEVVVLAARRTRGVKRPPRHEALPDWITTGRTPVPLEASFQLQIASTRIHAFLMSLIDGRRSLRDMAAIMEAKRLMPKADAETAIRGFLIRMFDESRQ